MLPFLISVPHGGRSTPMELEGRVALTGIEILDDADAFTDRLFDIRNLVAGIQIAEIARPFVDLNRSTDQMPPEYPDGLIKSRTSYSVPVYKDGLEPDHTLRDTLIRKYYNPYHENLAQRLLSDDVMLMLDCHSMAEYPPPIAPDSKARRPLINLGNLEGVSCSTEMVHTLARSCMHAFDLEERDVRINYPFKGGFITKRYGNNPKPVIQVELNRVLYFDPNDPHIENSSRIDAVREQFSQALIEFHKAGEGISGD